MKINNVEIAIIGGTGVYDSGLLTNAKQVKVYTPFGAPADLITVGNYAGTTVAFLPRHGANHAYPPHQVPYRANIWALKELGVKRIIAPCAVGSLQENIHPGEIVVVDQFFDCTKNRKYGFYDGGEVCHISVSEPFCCQLRKLVIKCLEDMGISHHKKGTTVTIEGPRYSTRAESLFFKNVVKADIIGMTLVPECVLAREAEICYTSIATVTDYDSWAEHTVDTASVKNLMQSNVKIIRELLLKLIPQIESERNSCLCSTALQNAMI